MKTIFKKGDKLALVAPASFVTAEKLEKAVQNFEEMGFRVHYNSSVLLKHGYLAGNDQARLADLHRAYADKSIAGIVSVRGGYGTLRFLEMLDYQLINDNPKPLLGFSDITSLLLAIYQKTNSPVFHAPMGVSTFNDFTKNAFQKAMMESDSYSISAEAEAYVVNAGKAKGELLGGNLAVICSLLGTKFQPDFSGKIVFLEEVGEAPYRIDRMLSQLLMVKSMKKAAGIVLGTFARCNADKHYDDIQDSLSLKEVIIDRLSSLKIPVVYGFSFGHLENNAVLPIGRKAVLNGMNLKIKSAK